MRYIKAAATPQARIEKGIPPEGTMTLVNSHGAKPTVVVVDSDAAVLGALKFALEIEGYAVAPFRSAAEVLAQRNLPESGCLVIDLNLPGMNGLDLLKALRDRAVRLPAILLAGRAPPDVKRRAAAAAMSIVEKPLFGNALINAIRAKTIG